MRGSSIDNRHDRAALPHGDNAATDVGIGQLRGYLTAAPQSDIEYQDRVDQDAASLRGLLQ